MFTMVITYMWHLVIIFGRDLIVWIGTWRWLSHHLLGCRNNCLADVGIVVLGFSSPLILKILHGLLTNKGSVLMSSSCRRITAWSVVDRRSNIPVGHLLGDVLMMVQACLIRKNSRLEQSWCTAYRLLRYSPSILGGALDWSNGWSHYLSKIAESFRLLLVVFRLSIVVLAAHGWHVRLVYVLLVTVSHASCAGAIPLVWNSRFEWL